MNPTNTLIVSMVSIIVLLHVCPNQACLNKIRKLIRNKGKEDKPAALYPDESSLNKYSHSQAPAPLYIEIIQNADKSIIIRELDHPPVAMSQIAGDDLKEKSNESTTEANNSESTSPPSETRETETPEQKSGEETVEGEEEEEQLSPEDENVRREWGGNCTTVDWNRCNKIRHILVKDVINTPFQRKSLDLDCLVEPILCLTNGWTANRCHILCMAQCNPRLFFDWDGTVDFEGPCRYKK